MFERRVAEREAHVVAEREAGARLGQLMAAQDALADERHLLQTVLDGSPDLVYLKDTDRRFVRANAAVAAYLGVDSPSDLIGKTDGDFYPADQAAVWAADERRVMETGEALVDNAEPRFLDRDDTPHVVTTKVHLHDRSGRVTGIVGMARDVSDKVAAESAYCEGEERLRLALRAAHMST
ncbi:MAG: PAS domain-containing protein [Thermomicrobiales bacterium]